ncbi:MAG: ABC transporter substrate-binding protein [Clostridia bacterium]
MFRKLVSILLVLVLSLSLCSFASAQAIPEGRRVVEFWHCFGGVIGDAMLATVNAFNESQDKIFVNATFQGSYDDTLTKLKAALPAGTGPDVFQMFELGTCFLANTDYYVPYQDLLEKDPYISIDDIEGVLRNYYTVNGKMVCIPINPSSPIMYYNKTAFDKAGITEIPKTFDEIAAIAEQLTSVEGNPKYAFAPFIYGWFFENFLTGMSAYYVNNENGHADIATEIDFDKNGAGKAILEKWKELVDNGVIFNFGAGSTGSDGAKASFMAGESAIILQSTAQLTTITGGADFEVGCAYLPRIAGEEFQGVTIGGANLWIVKNPEEQRVQDAWEFVKFATSAEMSAKFSMATGYFAANTKAYDMDFYVEYLKQNPNAQVALNQLHDSPKTNVTAGSNVGVMTDLRANFEQVMELYLQGAYTTEEALAEMATLDNEAIAYYNKTVYNK